ncbi:MAG TPA: hemerythrin domain-containing protein [Candidatus Limnocylindrales bacterium]
MTIALVPGAIEGRIFEDEHRRIRAGVAALQETINDADRLGQLDAVERVTRIVIWLRRDLLPHAAWEEAWLYPQLDRDTGSAWTTRALRIEHRQIRELAGRLDVALEELHAHWNHRVLIALVAAMARLDAVLSAHLVQEDWFVLPLLDEPGTERDPKGGTPA